MDGMAEGIQFTFTCPKCGDDERCEECHKAWCESQEIEPEDPGELWMVWRKYNGGYMPALDTPKPFGRIYFVAFNEKDATALAQQQMEEYDLPCVVVQVKSNEPPGLF